MADSLIPDPRLPMLSLALAALLFTSSSALLWLPRVGWGALAEKLRAVPRAAGVAISGAVALTAWASGQALGLSGLGLALATLVALLAALVLGVYLPGLEARQHAARRARLSLQAIDFAGYMLLALRGPFGVAQVFDEYVRRPRRAVLDLQQLLRDILDEQRQAGRGNVLELLHRRAEQSGSAALTDVAATLREVVGQDRAQVAVALEEQRRQQMEELVAAQVRRAQRLENVILGVTAMALFLGLLLFILYVMTGGLTLLPI